MPNQNWRCKSNIQSFKTAPAIVKVPNSFDAASESLQHVLRHAGAVKIRYQYIKKP